MNITEFNTLYQLVLEGRAYCGLIPIFGLGMAISIFTTFFIFLIHIIEGVSISRLKYFLIGGGLSSLIFGTGLITCEFQSAIRPTMDDVKVITAYKVGESVVNSEEFNTIVHKLIDAIPQNNK